LLPENPLSCANIWGSEVLGRFDAVDEKVLKE
jgi:hypothetical protein